MDKPFFASLGGLILALAAVTLTYERSFVYDRLITSSVITFAFTGVLLLSICRIYPTYFSPVSTDLQYSTIPLDDRRQPHASREPSPERIGSGTTINPRTQRILFILVIFALCLRLEFLRWTLKEIQCTWSGIEAVGPFILAIWDFWRIQWRHPRDSDAPDSSAYVAILRGFTHGSTRYLMPALLLSWSGVLTAITSSTPRSTYICPGVLPYRKTLPLFQWLGLSLDCFILAAISELCVNRASEGTRKGGKGAHIIGWILIITAVLLSFIGLVSILVKGEFGQWIIRFDKAYISSLVGQTALFSTVVVCGTQVMLAVGVLGVSLTSLFVHSFVSGASYEWANGRPFPPTARASAIFSVCLLFLGASVFQYIYRVSEGPRSLFLAKRTFAKTSSSLSTLMALLFTFQALLLFAGSNTVDYHPIDMLIYNAKAQHEAWIKQASASRTLNQATEEYRRRYNRHPPPGFDEWYNFATSRSSLIIDDYDAIYDDLVRFWALSPSELRLETWKTISNPWNEISGISIRGGKADISPNVKPTHRWMLDGVVSLISQFAQWLPDMDLAFNLNDECRVAVPFDHAEETRKVGEGAGNLAVGKENQWSKDRASGWQPIPEEPFSETCFEDHSFSKTFWQYGSVGCPSRSKARQYRIWNTRQICTTCALPHSLGQFVQNWTLAADICHQPDMAELHGLYLSPAAFKTAHELVPVFSQSKAHGFNDILYPSAWNYMDKVKYEPSDDHPDRPFAEKENTLFWRGATSEGVSAEGTWKGMTRQRLVHLVNNLTETETVPILLPSMSQEGKYEYQTISGKDVRSLLRIDVGVVDKIARCGLRDCPDQEAEFGLLKPSDFQDHWRYRYLFDLDGAGFSGRFLPFLQSRSLPFKAALFRDWSDSRLTAWLHFVPQDLRLHGVHSTLAYFAGVNGKVDGKDVIMPAHEKEGAMIAETGREWAGKMLRKEDMEVYFFRLLLEWGRLTDDRRDEIGFQM